MRPYYDEAGVTLYHGDCREVLPQLDPVPVVVTDPPWPCVAGARNDKPIWGDTDVLALWQDTAPLLRSERVAVWLPCHADPRDWLAPVPLPFLRIAFIRRAIPGYYGRVLLDVEPVYVLGSWPAVRRGRLVIPGGLSITYVKGDRINDHPAPRSLEAAKFLVRWWSDEGDIVLDPFAGSGTTLRAAKDLGRKAIGIEIEERYCEIIARRMSQEVLL